MTRQRRPKPLVKGRTEKQVTAAVLDAAALFGLVLERRNVAVFQGASGKPVACGEAGDPDYTGVLPNGRRIDVEIKREGYEPAKLRGAKAEHFARQRARMEALNARGAFALWLDDGADMVRVLEILAKDPAATVTFDDDGHPRVTWREKPC